MATFYMRDSGKQEDEAAQVRAIKEELEKARQEVDRYERQMTTLTTEHNTICVEKLVQDGEIRVLLKTLDRARILIGLLFVMLVALLVLVVVK